MKEDPGYYDYWPYENRPKIEWPNGAQIAFWVAPNIEFYELDPPPNPYRTPWPQPHPAVPGYSIRDWGNRVGQKCAGYLAPALSHSERTLDLFAEIGTELFGEEGGFYSCDLFHDDQPTPIHLRSEKHFVSIPYSLEMNDTIAYLVQKVPPRQYGKALKDNFDRLYAEGAESGTIMCIPTHNYQVSIITESIEV